MRSFSRLQHILSGNNGCPCPAGGTPASILSFPLPRAYQALGLLLKAWDSPSLWAKRLRICLSLHFPCWEWFFVPLGSKSLRLIFVYWWGRIGRQRWPESSLSFLTSALWFEAKYPANNKVLFCLVVSLFPVHVSPPGTSREGKMAGQGRI